MRIVLGGVRGTSPVASESFLEFGGETTSILVRGEAGDRLVLDAGSGLRVLGQRLKAGDPPGAILFLLTHYHLDHIIGLPALSLLYDEDWVVKFAAPVREGWTVERAIRRILDKPFWPVRVSGLQASISFEDLPGEAIAEPRQYGELEIRWCSLCHPEGSTAYRVDEPASGGSVVLATDLEWARSTPEERDDLLRLLRTPYPVDILLFDGTYGQAEYERFQGWGHSTWEEAVSVAREGGVGRLLVTHHAPEADDSVLREIEAQVASRLPGSGLARGGSDLVSGD